MITGQVVREGVDFTVWRIVASQHMTASLTEIRNEWSMGDIVDAHLVMDMLDNLSKLE